MANNCIVKVKEGELCGAVRFTSNNFQYYAFKSIPYAKPPVGELRFSIPQEPESWVGVRDATQSCNICLQFDKQTKKVVGDEDCLYLNVYSPTISGNDQPMPVMVYIHGGGFLFGNGTDDSTNSPEYLVEKSVVTVFLNYRVGILGFLSLDRKEAPGNMGLRDQVQALKWVKNNIRNFGGDPNNVTIFGVSAGGASVEYLMLSSMAKGLFHKAIAQSGSSLLPWAQSNKISRLAAQIPVLDNKSIAADSLLAYLKEMPARQLVEYSMYAVAKEEFKGGIHFGFVPTIEKEGDWEAFLNRSTYELLLRGNFEKVPYMSGFCTREGLLMIPLMPQILEDLSKERDFIKHLPFVIADNEKNDVESLLKSIYIESENKNEDPDSFAIDFFTDVDFLGGIYVAVKLIAKHNSPTFLYEFSYDGSLNAVKKKMCVDRKGACHGDEGGYLIKDKNLFEKPTEVDELVRERMVTMWTNFAKYGNPTPVLNEIISVKWDPFTEISSAFLLIDEKLTMKYDPYPKRMQLYENFCKTKNLF